MLVPPKLGFRTFDSVPRNHKPLVLTVVLMAVTALSLFGWRAAHRHGSVGKQRHAQIAMTVPGGDAR